MTTLFSPLANATQVKAPTLIHAVVKGLGMQYFSVTGTAEEIAKLRKDPDAVMALASQGRAAEAHYEAMERTRLINERVWEGFGPNRGGQYWSLGLAADAEASAV